MTRNATARNIGKTDKSAILDEVERLADILLTSSDGPDLDVTTKLEVFDLVEELTRTSPEEPSPIVRWYNDEARRDDSDNGNDGPVQSKPATVLGRIIAELSRIRFATDERRHNATGDRKTSEVVSWRAKGHSLKRQVENARQVYGIKCDSGNSRKPLGTKRSTHSGEARIKLISALTDHHKYADGSCLNQTPVANNELARRADVSKSTASEFFKSEFDGHMKYRGICSDVKRLIVALRLLNNEFSPLHLYGAEPPGERNREDGE